MNERENCLKVYNHEIPDWIPIDDHAIYSVGFWAGNERGERGERVTPTENLDAFGMPWAVLENNDLMPALRYGIYLEDICDWKNVVRFPDVDRWPWEQLAEFELANYDGSMILRYFCEEGLFDRLTALMGFEGALIALLTEEEACHELFDALVEYKIKIIKNVAQYFKPDVFMYTDDLAQKTGLFMSPETFRSVIKPHHQKIISAIKEHGMIAEQHTCGKCDDIVADFVEMGVEVLFPAQASNDLVKIKNLYGDKLVICGGLDSQGPSCRENAPEDVLRNEARRMVDSYARGGGYIATIFAPGIELPDNVEIMEQEFRDYSNGFYEKAENRTW